MARRSSGTEGKQARRQHQAVRRPATSRGAKKLVRDVMVKDVVTIDGAASVAEAARLMEQANVGMLVVVDDQRRLRGVITDRDIVVRAVARGAEGSATRVEECLTSEVAHARPEWPIDRAMQAMAGAHVGRLPVLDDDDRPVGVVTLSSMAFRAPDESGALRTAREVSRRSARTAA
jgi:CBS domain-containing protein